MTSSPSLEPEAKAPVILSFCSFKGGVGKTTTCLNLAHKMARSGQQVMIVDFDPLGTATRILLGAKLADTGAYDLITGRGTRDGLSLPSWIENISVLPATPLLHLAELEPAFHQATAEDFRRRLQSGAQHTDAILIDTGPGLGVIAVTAIAASDMVVIPVMPDPQAVAGLERTLDVIGACDAEKPFQIALGVNGEPTLAQDAFGIELKRRYGDRVVPVRFRPLPEPGPHLAVSAA